MKPTVDCGTWIVPDDFAIRFMTQEAEFCEREAIDCRKRGCNDYVVMHYARRAELLREAVARLKVSSVPS